MPCSCRRGVSNYMGCVFHVINDLEQIGDHAIKILVQTEKCVEMGQAYSQAAQDELRQIYRWIWICSIRR